MSTSPTVEQFVAAARTALPDEHIGPFKVRTYGGSKAMADIIVPLVLSGEKTGTFALAAEFDDDPSRAPRVGDDYVVTYFDGTPALLQRITEVQVVPFEGIDHDHVQVEGPKARDVAVWRGIHWDYWGGMLRARGREPSPQMPVIFQRFRVLFPRRSG
jgi:uncharacterized protein YhfF